MTGDAPAEDSGRDDRADIAAARRVVVKVGSSSLTTADGGIDEGRIAALAGVLADQVRTGTQVVLVSSGAIAAGLAPLGLARRPRDLATQQAAASVGQGLLVAVYTAAFARHEVQTGQILLTADDLMRRAHYRNAQRTLNRLLELGVLPVVNENDTVATDEIRFGDNDRLAALVAHVVRAGALILLSDVDGLYDFDPRHPGARRISRVQHRADLEGVTLGPPGRPGATAAGRAWSPEHAGSAGRAGSPERPGHRGRAVRWGRWAPGEWSPRWMRRSSRPRRASPRWWPGPTRRRWPWQASRLAPTSPRTTAARPPGNCGWRTRRPPGAR